MAACLCVGVDEELRQHMYVHTEQFCGAVETLLSMHQARLMASLSAAADTVTSQPSADDITNTVISSLFSFLLS